MNYCGNCDIAYEERTCPLCEAKREIERLEVALEEERSRERIPGE
jgi:hypothetical protein